MNDVRYQTPAVPLASFNVAFPHIPIDQNIDHAAKSELAIQQLANLRKSQLTDNAMLRDLLALTGTFRTFSGPQSVEAVWKELTSIHKPYDYSLIPGTSHVVRLGPQISWIDARFTFRTQKENFLPTRSSGIIRIVPDGDGNWKIWIIVTILEDIEGFGQVDILEPMSDEQSKRERAENGPESKKDFFECAIIGGGQSGLSLSGRLRALGVPYVCLDRNEQIGGNWLTRYESFKLHTSKECGHLPFSRTWPKEDPYFLSRKEIAAGFERYVNWYGINIWQSTNVEKVGWDSRSNIWTLEINRLGQKSTLRAKHLVFAVGSGGQTPVKPEYPNRELFSGEDLHSVKYYNSAKWSGKRGIIIGTANTAHDVAEDMLDAGLSSVTMVQRSPTMIYPLATYKALIGSMYTENTDINETDRMVMSIPMSVMRTMALGGIGKMADANPEIFDSLEHAGFKTIRHVDLYHVLYERKGGHYFDVGTSAKVAAGLIKTKYGTIERYTKSGLEFTDGTRLDADVIVWCTGFEGNMRREVTAIVGQEMANQLEDFWCVDKEGELIGAWKPMAGQKNIWYMAGDMMLARYISRFLALQIKADIESKPLEVYLKTPTFGTET